MKKRLTDRIVSKTHQKPQKTVASNVRNPTVNRLPMMNAHQTILSWYDDYADELFGFALIKTKNRDEAQDCVQEAFLRICKYVEKKKEIKNPRAFLYRILKNIIIDRYRKHKPESLDEIIEESGAKEQESAQANLEKTVSAKHILRKIEQIEEQYRKPFIMRYVHDLSPKEIAKALRISENTASVRIHRAKKLVKELFTD